MSQIRNHQDVYEHSGTEIAIFSDGTVAIDTDESNTGDDSGSNSSSGTNNDVGKVYHRDTSILVG